MHFEIVLHVITVKPALKGTCIKQITNTVYKGHFRFLHLMNNAYHLNLTVYKVQLHRDPCNSPR